MTISDETPIFHLTPNEPDADAMRSTNLPLGRSEFAQHWKPTVKQREVLDLLIQHRTSKQIALALGISRHTVDQRIDAARAQLGCATRAEVAMAYRQMLSISERSIYEFSHVSLDAHLINKPPRTDTDLMQQSGLPLLRVEDDESENHDFRVGPELLYGRWGTLMRVAIIFALAALLLIAIIGGLGLYVSLSQFLRP